MRQITRWIRRVFFISVGLVLMSIVAFLGYVAIGVAYAPELDRYVLAIVLLAAVFFLHIAGGIATEWERWWYEWQ